MADLSDKSLATEDIIIPCMKELTGVPFQVEFKDTRGNALIMAGEFPEKKKRWYGRFLKNELPVDLADDNIADGAIFTDLRYGTKFLRIKKGWLKVIMI
jgi:hypothetical protein